MHAFHKDLIGVNNCPLLLKFKETAKYLRSAGIPTILITWSVVVYYSSSQLCCSVHEVQNQSTQQAIGPDHSKSNIHIAEIDGCQSHQPLLACQRNCQRTRTRPPAEMLSNMHVIDRLAPSGFSDRWVYHEMLSNSPSYTQVFRASCSSVLAKIVSIPQGQITYPPDHMCAH